MMPRSVPIVIPPPRPTALHPEIVAYLRRVGRTQGYRPILVGPWVSEIGFELLYWIPFLRWAVESEHLPGDRLWILSRGGAAPWYAPITPRYLELYDLLTPDQLRIGNAARVAEQRIRAALLGLRRYQISAKQFYLSQWERDLATRAARKAGLRDPIILHPSIMYHAFRALWRHFKRDPWPHYIPLATMRRIPKPPRPAGLPSAYVAVKWYTSSACPDAARERDAVARILESITATDEIVLLHSGVRYDEHGEFPIADDPRVHRIALEPATNLATQTGVIAYASRFVGTYGGFAYLAPMLGVPTLALYGEANFRSDHLQVMRECARRVLRVPFRVARLEDVIAPIREIPDDTAA